MENKNLDIWEYYGENRNLEFMEWMNSNNVTTGPNIPRTPIVNVDVNCQKFIEYALANKETCQIKSYEPRPSMRDVSNFEIGLALNIGRHSGNTLEFNWGMFGNTNEEIKNLINQDQLVKIGYIPDTVSARLLIYLPGHGIPWHRDLLDSWDLKFKHLNFDISTFRCDLGEVRRRVLMVSDWHWGHMLQLNNSVITHWNSGDVYDIPIGEWHLGINAGVMPKVSISLTGAINSEAVD